MMRLLLKTIGFSTAATVALATVGCARKSAPADAGRRHRSDEPRAKAPSKKEPTKPKRNRPAAESATSKTALVANAKVVQSLVERLVKKHGAKHRARIARGVRQVARYWRRSDGDVKALRRFLGKQLLVDQGAVDKLLARLEALFEQVDGHITEIARTLRFNTDVDTGPILPVDKLTATVAPGAHLVEDFFRAKVAFAVLANFPLATLAERIRDGGRWSRRRWAEDRLAGRFARRIPGEVSQRITAAGARSGLYISSYNIYMHHVLDRAGKRLFPKGKRLITHWNLRDELKAAYADKDGLARQRVIAKVMDHIVKQTIPRVVIDNPRVDWNPFTGAVKAAPPATVEPGKASGPSKITTGREPDTRYRRLLDCFLAAREADPYSPMAPTLIARRFDIEREIPEKRFVALIGKVLTAPVLKRIAKIIARRLGRKLEPFDIWYDGFRPRSRFSETKLDGITKKRYPTVASFQKALPRILGELGFSAARSRYLADRIVVDPSRGAGHALESQRREDKPRLRTRIGKDGMDYKGYNIAVHELGHNVEQVFSLFDVDHTLLQGVPNTAFTEALAFVFQVRDLELLGLSKPDAKSRNLKVLNTLWMTFEIGGVGIVDLEVWRWMYAHPNATPAELREATLKIAKDVWNRYYAPVFGVANSSILAVYSHMISYYLYLPDYSLGHIIAFQIEEYLRQGKALGKEFERMARYGRVTPDLWMRHATGRPISPEILVRAAERSAAEVEKASKP